jgi:GH24 family phage-related lysozyme (muramidase)
MSTLPTDHTPVTPDTLDPITGGPLYINGSGNDCERQATVPATSLTASGNTATLKVDTPITMSAGDQIVIAGADQSEYNGTFTITSVNGSQVTFTLTQAPSAVQATGTITARPANVATGQDCIDQMTKQIQDLEDRINQLQEQLSSSVGQMEPAMQGMSLDQQQQYVSCLQNNLNKFLNGGGNGLGTALGMTNTGSTSMFSSLLGNNCAQINPNGNQSLTSPGDPGTSGSSYLAGKGSCDVNNHSPMTTRTPTGDFNITSTGDQCSKQTQEKAGIAGNSDFSNCLSNEGAGDQNSTLNQVVTLISSREGWRNKAYWDVKGYSIGIGHFCGSGECSAGTVWTNEQIMSTFKQDVQKYWNAALKQQDQLCLNDSCFFTHLVSVNYQLGTAWNTQVLPSVWNMLKQGNFSAAANFIGGIKWAKQTPVRVKDFQTSLLAMKGQKMCNGKVIT